MRKTLFLLVVFLLFLYIILLIAENKKEKEIHWSREEPKIALDPLQEGEPRDMNPIDLEETETQETLSTKDEIVERELRKERLEDSTKEDWRRRPSPEYR